MEEMFGNDSDDDGEVNSCRPATCGVFSFHNGTEEAMYNFVVATAPKGDATSILDAIDKFCYSRHWMMHIGDKKLRYLQQALNSCRDARVCMEIGSYCGYSAVFIANSMPANCHLYCIENSIQCVRWTQRLVDYAELSSKITVIHGEITGVFDGALKIYAEMVSGKATVDFLFIDHDKVKYLQDLQTIEESDLLSTGSVVAADNILSHGFPLTDYLKHVKDLSNTGRYSNSVTYLSEIEYSSEQCQPQLNTAIATESMVGSHGVTSLELLLEKLTICDKHTVDAIEISIYK